MWGVRLTKWPFEATNQWKSWLHSTVNSSFCVFWPLWLDNKGIASLWRVISVGVARWEQSIVIYSCELLVVVAGGLIKWDFPTFLPLLEVICCRLVLFACALVLFLRLGMVWHTVLHCTAVVECLFEAVFLENRPRVGNPRGNECLK